MGEFVEQGDASFAGLSTLGQDIRHGKPVPPLVLEDLGENGLWLDASTHALPRAGNGLALLFALRQAGEKTSEALIYTRKDPFRKDDEDDADAEDNFELAPDDREKIRQHLYHLVEGIALGMTAVSEEDLMTIALAGAEYGGGQLTMRDIRDIAKNAKDYNDEYLKNFVEDMKDDIDDLVEASYTDEEAFAEEVGGRFDAFTSRAGSYVAGGKQAWNEAVMESSKANDTPGCIWNTNFGPGSCADCMALHGQWMTWEEFDSIFGTTICDGGCNCGPVPAENPDDLTLEDLDMEAA